jgi:hypothetical protein
MKTMSGGAVKAGPRPEKKIPKNSESVRRDRVEGELNPLS